MPLEGVSSSGPLIPAQQLAEAATLGAFNAKVEHSAPIKKTEENKESETDGNDDKTDGGNLASGYYTESPSEESSKETPSPNAVPSKDQRKMKYTIRFNKYTEMVELVDFANGKILQTIPPHDLISLISELKLSSGFFVDNEV
jgi:hypothetical protein